MLNKFLPLFGSEHREIEIRDAFEKVLQECGDPNPVYTNERWNELVQFVAVYRGTTTWRVTNKNAEPDSVMVNQTFGTKRKNAYEIFAHDRRIGSALRGRAGY